MTGDYEQLIHDIVYGTTDQRATAAAALGELGDPQAIEPLLELLKDPFSIVRCAAIQSLGKLRDRQVVEPLLNNLGRPDEHTRARGLFPLGLPCSSSCLWRCSSAREGGNGEADLNWFAPNSRE